MKYYLLHLPLNDTPALHGPLKTEVATDLKQSEIESGLNFSESDQLICLSVTGHGEIVRAESRVFESFADESDTPESDLIEQVPQTARLF